MSELRQTVRRAQRRLWLNRWLGILGWCLAGAAVAFTLGVIVQRLFWPTHERAGLLAGSLLAVALLVSAIWLLIRRDNTRTAAARLDQAAGLKERISSGLYCERSDDPFAKAVLTDAERAAAGMAVRYHLPLQVPRSAPYAGGTVFAALIFFLAFPVLDLTGKQQQLQAEQQRSQRIDKVQAIMKPVIEQQIKRVAEKNPSLKKDLEQLDPLKEAKLETPADVRQEAVKQIQKLQDKKQEERNKSELAKVDEFRKMMRQLGQQQKSNSPVSALSKALAQGDFKSAQDALNEIKEELAKAPTSEEEKKRAEELKKQVEQLANKIDKIASENKKMADELAKSNLTQEEIKRALEQLQKKDLNAMAKELEKKGLSKQQIDKLMDQAKKTMDAGKMANQMAQCMREGCQQGDSSTGQLSKSAQDALSQAGEQLSDMEAMQQEMNQLDSQLSDLQNLKDQMGKGGGDGDGEGEGQGSGMADGGEGQGGKGPGMGGMGQGEGGVAPVEQTSFKTAQKKSPVNTLPGSIISQQFVNGEQYKGEVSKDFVEATIAAQRDATDAIAREQIPRALQGPVSKFFTRSVDELPAGSKATTTQPQ